MIPYTCGAIAMWCGGGSPMHERAALELFIGCVFST